MRIHRQNSERLSSRLWKMIHIKCLIRSQFMSYVNSQAASTAKEEIEKDREAIVNGQTKFQQGLTDEMFTLLATDPHALISIGGGQRQAAIFDTGASLGVTFDKDVFDGPSTVPEGDLRLGGMASGLKIEGVGPVTWTFWNSDGTELQIRSQCYYVPAAKVRLLSPQRLFNKSKGIKGTFQGNEEAFILQLEGCQRLVVQYDSRNHLPI